jgi:SnoaL-like domain
VKIIWFLVFFVTTVNIVSAQHSHDEINKFIDNWHQAAGRADATVFFGGMDEQAVYIGTDATERWTKTEFVLFAKPYFDKGKAWDFKPYDRELHVTSDAKMVWFSELLSTWMGVCRGSGILAMTPQGWKIQQYHLSVTVPNDLIRDFITLVDTYNKKAK